MKRIPLMVLCLLAMGRGAPVDMTATIADVRAGLQPLAVTQPPKTTQAEATFLEYYGLDIEGAAHWLGTRRAGPYTLAVHVFEPATPKATALICHGYYDHAGIWKHVIRDLVGRDYRVVVYDQPGHGLTDGERASIGSFSEYVAVLDIMATWCRTTYGEPRVLLAHSTGCSAVMDYVLSGKGTPFKSIVLLAPLIRSVAWEVSGVGLDLGADLLKSVPRKFRKNSSDKAFVAFMRRDPLQAKHVPVAWIKAHRDWVETLMVAQPCVYPIKVIQGTKDTTVAWKYNLPVLKKKFPKADISLVEGAGHQLINERKALRDQTLRLVRAWLERGDTTERDT